MQTLPTFVYLIPVLVLFGLGMVPGLVATVIFAMPAAIRLTELGIRSTPTALSEAATAFGATGAQRILKVELPWAFPQIMAGLNQTIMLSLSMVVIAGLVGAPGLGVPVVRALNSVNASLGFESGAVIVAVAIMLDRMLRVERRA
jgi:glycine betaine/proline transport system permease protein